MADECILLSDSKKTEINWSMAQPTYTFKVILDIRDSTSYFRSNSFIYSTWRSDISQVIPLKWMQKKRHIASQSHIKRNVYCNLINFKQHFLLNLALMKLNHNLYVKLRTRSVGIEFGPSHRKDPEKSPISRAYRTKSNSKVSHSRGRFCPVWKLLCGKFHRYHPDIAWSK